MPRLTQTRHQHPSVLGHRLLSMIVAVIMAQIKLGSVIASAQIVNGSFETGTLDGWSSSAGEGINPDTYVHRERPGHGRYIATDGLYLASIDASALSFGGYTDFQIAWIAQPFFAGVGDTLSFDYKASSSGYGWTGASARASLLRPGQAEFDTIVDVSNAPWTSVATPLSTAGIYTIEFKSLALAGIDSDFDFSESAQLLDIDRVVVEPLSTESSPILPNEALPGENGFLFLNAPSGQWFDPPTAQGFAYQMTSGALFTKILDFPSGFSQPFHVAVNGIELGTFGPGDGLDFTGFSGGGVSHFEVTGLDPLADPSNPTAFPIRLMFDSDYASFSMSAIAVPEPSSILLFALGLGMMTIRRLSRVGQVRRT